MRRMSSERKQTIEIIDSKVGAVLVMAIIIAGLVVTQHAAMRAAAVEEQSVIKAENAALCGDIVEMRIDIREIRSGLSDLAERVTWIEVHVDVPAHNL